MTVKELIAKLLELPDQDKEIKIEYDDGWIRSDISLRIGNVDHDSSQPEEYLLG